MRVGFSFCMLWGFLKFKSLNMARLNNVGNHSRVCEKKTKALEILPNNPFNPSFDQQCYVVNSWNFSKQQFLLDWNCDFDSSICPAQSDVISPSEGFTWIGYDDGGWIFGSNRHYSIYNNWYNPGYVGGCACWWYLNGQGSMDDIHYQELINECNKTIKLGDVIIVKDVNSIMVGYRLREIKLNESHFK